MASGLIFDPIKILRVAPLLTTTSSLVYAWDEHWYLSGFLHSNTKHETEIEKIFPTYFRRFFEKGIFVLLGTGAITISTSIGNLFSLNDNGGGLAPDSSSRLFYWAGLGFTLAHFLFVPVIAYPIRDIVEDRRDSTGKSTVIGNLKKWLDIHRVRTLLADFPAWLSFLGGLLLSVKV